MFADISPSIKQFRCSRCDIPCEEVAAFRWTDGKLLGLGLDGDPELEQEYLYVHLQKRHMNFTLGLENEDSFMIIPNEFVKDHELTFEEIQALITPDTEYERTIKNRKNFSLLMRIKRFLNSSFAYKKLVVHRNLNKLLGRKLYRCYR